MNSAISSPESFKTNDAASYDRVVDSYDVFVDRFSQPLAERVVSLAGLRRSERVLDIGTGTGIVALKAARAVEAGGKVLGIDLSAGMLAKATAKTLTAKVADRLQFRKMDAEALELEDDSFDAAVSLFALLHFPNPERALTEAFRVLRPGGRIVVGIGSGPPIFSINGVRNLIRRTREVPLLLTGKILTAPAYLNKLTERHLGLGFEPEEAPVARLNKCRCHVLQTLVRKAGFVSLRSDWDGFRVELESPEEFWEVQNTFSTIARKRLAKAPSEQVELLREEFLETCRQIQLRGGKLVYPYAAYWVVARRPEEPGRN